MDARVYRATGVVLSQSPLLVVAAAAAAAVASTAAVRRGVYSKFANLQLGQ